MRSIVTTLASAAACAAALLVQAPGAAATPLHAYANVTLSPDGMRLAAIESDEPPRDGDPVVNRLVIRATSGGAPVVVALPCGAVPDCEPSSPVWSLDGKRVAFILRSPKSKRRDIDSVAADGTHLHTQLHFSGSVTSLHALPGDALAMLATPGARKDPGATSAAAPLTGEIGASPDEQRIAVVDAAGRLRFASPPNLYVYEYDPVPGGGFVGTAAEGDGDNNWWIGKLYGFDADGRARIVYAPSSPQQQLAEPRVSPDGTRVAFIGGIMSDFGATGGDVYTVPLAGGTATNATPNADSSAVALYWECGEAGGQRLAFTAQRGPDMRLERLDPNTTQQPQIQRAFPKASVAEFAHSCNAGKTLATVAEDFAHAPEIAVARNDGAFQPLTHANAAAGAVASATDIAWKSDGFTVDGWLLVPQRNAGAAKRAMITVVHGGPSAAYRPRFIGRGVVRSLLQHGYDVFEPNPRGSFGHGETFTLANVKDFGYGDLRDVLAGIDAVEQHAPVDEARLGIYGYSYGGYMTMWTVTQTDRFKAAVAGAGVSDWESYYGENGIDRWMIPFFGASVYDDPAVYAKSSPIAFIKRVRTPTFEFVGSDDVECPAPQTQEFWHALASLGVPTQFVVYPGEGHGLRGPRGAKDRADSERRTLAWFAHYLR